MKRSLIGVVFAVGLAVGGLARAQGFERLSEGAPVYAVVRPASFFAALKRVGVGELPEVQDLRKQLGGMDPLDPVLLGPTGLDAASPMVGSFLEPAGPERQHHRVVGVLRDKSVLGGFLVGLSMTGQVPIKAPAADSPLAKAGVLAWMPLDTFGVAVLRVDGDVAVIDAVTVTAGKPPEALEIAKRWPLLPKVAFKPARGGRKLLASEQAVAIYTDGRALGPVLELLDRDGGKKKIAPACKRDWSAKTTPAIFDDAVVAVAVEPDGMRLSLAWGTQGGAPLGGLKLRAVDDQAYDVDLLSHQAAAMVALFAADLKPFQALKRTGPFATSSSLQSSADKCGALAAGHLLVRSWPLAIGALSAEAKKGSAGGGDPLSSAGAAFGQLRTAVAAFRDSAQAGPRWVVGATLDAQAKTLVDALLALAGQGTPTPMANQRTPLVYQLTMGGTSLAAASELLSGGPLAVTVADSADTLSWSYRAQTRVAGAPAAGPTPLLQLGLDGPAVAAQLSALGIRGKDGAMLRKILTKLRRVDGQLVADGDLLRLEARAPLK